MRRLLMLSVALILLGQIACAEAKPVALAIERKAVAIIAAAASFVAACVGSGESK